MKTPKPFLLLLLCISIATSCKNGKNNETSTHKKNDYKEIEQIKWIIGSWEHYTEDGILTETWTILNDSVFNGKSLLVSAGDTQFVETITIEQRGSEVFYIPVVKDQNNGQPVMFKYSNDNKTEREGQIAIFNNPEHDFPQTITYQLKTDSLIAQISGKREGKEMVEKFPMVRVVPIVVPWDK